MWKTKKLNSEWSKYNDLFNESREGFNPHEKYITSYVEKKEIFNKLYTVDEAKETLIKLKESLPKHTDAKKIQGCKECIEILENHLKEIE